MIRLLLPALLGVLVWGAATPALAVECWTGWGYWVEPGTRAYQGPRLLLVTRGPASWIPGRAEQLYLLDPTKGGIQEGEAPLTVIPQLPRYSRQQGLIYVNDMVPVEGSENYLTFGLSYIKPTVTGIERLDDFYLWACGLKPSSGPAAHVHKDEGSAAN